jgi:hypothetical protein
MKKILIVIALLLASLTSYSQQLERYYRNGFAIIMNGQQEVRLPNRRVVDIVTDTFAIEVEFANKWTQSIGQSLDYAKSLNKKAGILLVIEGVKTDRYVTELMDFIVFYRLPIKVWVMDSIDDSWGTVDIITTVKYIY